MSVQPNASRQPRHTGRPPGQSTVRRDMLDSAVRLFAERGFEGTTLRAVTDRAGVDVALVKHYFGNKQGLFEEAVLEVTDDISDLFEVLRNPGSGTSGRTTARAIADAYLCIWETEPNATRMKAFLRAALESEGLRTRVQQVINERLENYTTAEHRPRLQLLATHLVGVGITRYILEFSPLSELSHEQMVDDLAPMIESYLP